MSAQDKLFIATIAASLILFVGLLVLLWRFPLKPIIPPMPDLPPLPSWEYFKTEADVSIKCVADGQDVVVMVGTHEGKVLAEYTLHPSIIEKAGWVRK